MKSFYIAKSLLFLGSALIFINLLEVSQTHLFSLDALVQFTLLVALLGLLSTKRIDCNIIDQKKEFEKISRVRSPLLLKLSTMSIALHFIILFFDEVFL